MTPTEPDDDYGDSNPYDIFAHVMRWHTDDEEEFQIDLRWAARAVIALVAAAAIAVAFAVFFVLREIYFAVNWERVQKYLMEDHWQIAAAALGILVAWGLYMFRCWHRNYYGMLEIGIGAVMCWSACGSFAGTEPMDEHKLWAARATLASSIYVLVRGMDNMMEGFAKKKKAREDGQNARQKKENETILAELVEAHKRARAGADKIPADSSKLPDTTGTN